MVQTARGLLMTRFALLITSALLAACGGGDPGPPMPSGKVDVSYGEGGTVSTAGTSLAIAPDGSVFVSMQGQVVKYDADGRRAPHFVTGSFASFPWFLLPGESGTLRFVTDTSVAMVDAAGRLVPAFGVAGLAWLGVGEPLAISRVASAPDGGLYVVENYFFGAALRYRVLRLDASGRRVSSFGTAGVADIVEAGGGIDLAVDAGGNLYFVTDRWSPVSFSKRPVVIKLDAAGRTVAAFGVNGVWLGPECSAFRHRAPLIAFADDDSLLVATSCDSPRDDVVDRVALFKVDAAGGLVASFRDSGMGAPLFGDDPEVSAAAPYATALVVGRDGAIYVAGVAGRLSTACSYFALAKLDRSGIRVTSFSDGGTFLIPAKDAYHAALGLDREGRLYFGTVGERPCPSPPAGGAIRPPEPAAVRYGVDIYRLTP